MQRSPMEIMRLYSSNRVDSNNTTAITDLDGIVSRDDPSQLAAQVDALFTTLGNRVDLFIIDARTHASFSKDPIWEIPLSQWTDDTSRVALCKLLCQVKSFLQRQTKTQETHPCSIVILGYKSSFESSLDQIIFKLQRDVTFLHADNSIHFLDIGQNAYDASAQSIATAIAILASQKPDSTIVFLHNISSLCISTTKPSDAAPNANDPSIQSTRIPAPVSTPRPKVKIALSFDFDALSAFLGTGHHSDNNLSDYSSGIFAGRIGALRLLRTLQKHRIANKVTWFIPGHTMETFTDTVREIIASDAEIGLHGYAHEGAYQMSPEQERDVLTKCMDVCQQLTGKKVLGYRAPMYQLRETTIALLREYGFLYDSSLGHHDSQPYFVPDDPPAKPVDFSQPASSWLKPSAVSATDTPPAGSHPLVEIPTGWNNEDMMALQYFPHLDNSHGHVDARVVEQRWKDMFLWLWENARMEGPRDGSYVFPILMHPDTSGMAHVIGMVDRFIGWLAEWGDSVQFVTFEGIARSFSEQVRN